MIRVFLSYAHEDLVAARRLWSELDSLPAVSVWFDKESLFPGQNWKREIKSSIESADYFLLLLSSRSVSKQGFYQREIRLSLEALAEQPPGKIYLIPVRLDDCKVQFDELEALQYVDLFPTWDRGMAAIFRVLETHRRAVQAPSVGGSVRFTSHQARFVAKQELLYFVTVTNISSTPVEISHLWYEDARYHVPIRPASRPLPQRLEPSQSWTSWLSKDEVPDTTRENAYDLFKLRLSTGEIVAARKEDTVPPFGSVPGGPILSSDLEESDGYSTTTERSWPPEQR